MPGLIALAAIAISVWWLVASRMADAAFDRWMANEAVAGRQWTCEARRLGGFPFRVELGCAPFTMVADKGDVTSLSLGGFVAVAQTYDPKHVLVDFASPLKTSTPDGQSASLSWRAMRSSLHMANAIRADRVSWSADDIALETSNPLIAGTLAHAEFHLRKVENEADQRADLETVLALHDAKLRGVGDAGQFDAHLIAKKGWLVADNPTLSGIDEWRADGGEMVIDQWEAKRGDESLSLKGSLGLDEGRRLNGKLDVSATGLGDVLKSFGPSPFGGSIGAGQVSLPLRFANGRVMVGPLKLAELPPLY
jgi:hypothetical protein